ncbi:MAG TPA: benzoate-CoA ligase family protein [Blastocatellia bacterium]|nr:benzoate-CoA ligase family protein [Blastocatellia bacterium]
MPDCFDLCDYLLGGKRLAQIGDTPAIEFRGRCVTYRELEDQVSIWAARLVSAGAQTGDAVALYLYDSPEFVAAFLAAARLGLVAVPVNTFQPPEAVSLILEDSNARVLVAESELTDTLGARTATLPAKGRLIRVDTNSRRPLDYAECAAQFQPLKLTTDSPAFILYTSGSTGAPKGVLHTRGAIPATVETYGATVLKLRPGDRTYSASRLFFAYGFGNSLSFPLAAGATAILHTERPTPKVIASVLDKNAPTVFFAVPSIYRALIDLHRRGTAVNTASLRLCISAAEPLPPRVFDDWNREFGLPILDGIGSTEMLHIFISNHHGDERPGATGTVVEGYEARLLDDGGDSISGEGTGQLWVRGGSAFAGYRNLPDLTAQTVSDGWVRTGDIYRLEDGRYFYYVGRSDECFKVKGMWVSPLEVEAALISHPDVTEAAVVPDFDSAGLATVHAFVVIGTDRARGDVAAELRSHAGLRLARNKIPSVITVLDELPRTATGKVQRFKLRTERVAPSDVQ